MHAIIESGRAIRLINNIKNDEVSKAYAVSNCAHDIPISELISLYPGRNTCGSVQHWFRPTTGSG
jgi:hypothetical protein